MTAGWTTLEDLSLAETEADARLRALGLSPFGDRRIVKQGSISVVWRQQTVGGPDVFFKVVPPLFAQEPPLTEWLSRRWPAHAPRVLASDRRRRWMLTRAVEGVTLAELSSPEPWLATVRTLARIQIDSIDWAAELLDCGCPTRAVAALPDELAFLMPDAIPLWAGQGAAVPEDLVDAVHGRHAGVVEDTARLAALGVPTTLIHGDFHADNVIMSAQDDSPVILDWTDGTLTHPFFHLLIFLRGRAATHVAAHRDTMVHAYLAEWTRARVAPIGTLQEAFAIAQRLAPLYHAGSYRRVFGIGAAAAAEFAELLPWLLGLLIEARPSVTAADTCPDT